jgi:hypothetical protein
LSSINNLTCQIKNYFDVAILHTWMDIYRSGLYSQIQSIVHELIQALWDRFVNPGFGGVSVRTHAHTPKSGYFHGEILMTLNSKFGIHPVIACFQYRNR